MGTTQIKEIRIQYFKFFQKEEPIIINGKHLLLYGENGSGKSSLYWSLYTLLECANKDDVKEIRKYFHPRNRENLLNIYKGPNEEAFIELHLLDNTIFRVSHRDVVINQNTDAQISNYSSNFVTYRSLLSISNFAHSESVELFGFFSYAIFPYVKFDTSISYKGEVIRSPNRAWKLIQEGLSDDFADPTSGNPRFPFPGETPYEEYLKLIKDFEKSLKELLTSIIAIGNPILKSIDYDFSFSFQLLPKNYSQGAGKITYFDITASKQFRKPKFYINLSIPIYNGMHDIVKKPHSFLNEAKLTALGLAIRLAALEKSLGDDPKLKLLVFDDLLISLDMCNREKILDLILNKYQREYQLFFLTHDKRLFELLKLRIEQRQQNNWCYYEMYVNEDDNKPVLLPSESYYAKACYHLKQFDYPAAGNYFRKACEEIFEKLFPIEITTGPDGLKRKNLKNYVDAGISFYARLGIDESILKKLDIYVFLLMNPLSHRAVDENIYKNELSAVKKVILEITKEVQNYNFKNIVAAENKLVAVFKNDATTTSEYQIITKYPIYLYIEGGIEKISNSQCKSIQSKTIKMGLPDILKINNHYNEQNIIDIHKKIYSRWSIAYDNSYMENIFHEKSDGSKESLNVLKSKL